MLCSVPDLVFMLVNRDLIGDDTCASCKCSLRGSLVRKVTGTLCGVCVKPFCRNCFVERELFISSNKLSLPCCFTCKVFIEVLQNELSPWFRCAQSSCQLFKFETEVRQQHTQIFARLSNYEGLIRFMVQNKDPVLSHQEMVGPLLSIEESIKRGIGELGQMAKTLGRIDCPPFPPHRDELIKRALQSYMADQLSKIKTQFNIAHSLYETFANAGKDASILKPN
jgi:hypothetical protein